MAFWNSANIEPDRQYRWYIRFAQPPLTELRYALKKANRPTVKISEVTHKYLNHFYYYPGRLEWEPIQITFASAKVGKDATLADQILYNSLAASGYRYPNGATKEDTKSENLFTISKAKAVGQLTNSKNGTSIALVQIDAEGNDISTWYLWNPFFTEMKYDSLEYASEEIMNIDCTIKYDYATLNDAEGKVLAK